ncbi:MAG TPA: LuxR C-terminal-related transcriptional regulator [Solirubrobacterales bacterium]|nr:LuxR C-terminal-related transcriptional regulator [Solirubrobacterales bacterium]
MPQLPARDLHAALAFVDEAHSFADLDSFRSGILPGLEGLIPCDLVGYNEVPSGEDALVITYPDPPLEVAGEVLSRLAHQHPLIAVQANGDGRTYKISDFLSRREFHGLELYDELYRLLEAEDQIAFGLPGPMVIGIAMNRDRRSFSERDRALLDLLRPHLTHAHARLREREQLDRLIEALEHGLREQDTAVVALGPEGAIAAASGPALDLLAAYFPASQGASLPLPVAEWLADAPALGGKPLTVEGDRGRLTVRITASPRSGLVLVLEEECAASAETLRALGLTRRQSEVLHLLALGRGTDQIATELFISRQTVRKHLEHIYHRLGVHTREAAVDMARQTARSSP